MTTEEILAIQDSMLNDAQGLLVENEIGHLRALIRIVVEVSRYLIDNPAGHLQRASYIYNLDTILSGVDSFMLFDHAYTSLVGATSSQLDWNQCFPSGLMEAICSKYRSFISETEFTKKCRELLDLYKIQLALVATTYG